MNESEIAARLKRYKATADKRKQFNKPVPCLNCSGTGKFLELVEEIPTYVDCVRCEGTGVV
jgi:DnaJ-class molecular chaperone